ncbi:hypothetical protein ABK040_001458 [Willaertia magna]
MFKSENSETYDVYCKDRFYLLEEQLKENDKEIGIIGKKRVQNNINITTIHPRHFDFFGRLKSGLRYLFTNKGCIYMVYQ